MRKLCIKRLADREYMLERGFRWAVVTAFDGIVRSKHKQEKHALAIYRKWTQPMLGEKQTIKDRERFFVLRIY